MAAISCYQPCRSHLAQPARCFDEDERHLPTLSYRRRQFIERCYEVRGVRQRDPIAPEVSVKKTREELTKNAAQNATLNRRLNIESGWSKVEEVRKKFEGVAAAASTTVNSFSRSFESPPRRRLADSLFASFKLPRKKDNMAQPLSLMQHQQTKRKSAVELLAETKAFYVKSETVLDRKQELPLRVSSGLGQAIAAGGCHVVSSGVLHQDPCCNPYATTRSLGPSRRAISAGDGLQNTLRKLLEHSDSREDVYLPPSYFQHKVFPSPRLSGTSSSGTSSRHPRQLSYTSIGSSPEAMELPEPVMSVDQDQQCTDIGAISPPAQYAHSAHSRCTSRCTAPPRTDPQNINSHKSLPDLHTHTRCYHEHSNISGTDTIGRSPRRRRHSAHQRTASCSSKGTRSNHSSLLSSCEAFSEHPSPAEDNSYHYNRCGSSFARDSGGSSGHYTQRSAPPHAYHDNMMCVEWVCAPPAFQDGAPSPPPAPPPPRPTALVGIHLQARAPPPQFQDDPPPYEYRTHPKCPPLRKECSNRRYHRHHETTELVNKAHFMESRVHRPRDDTQDYVNATQMCPPEEVTSPLGTFKRQRCLRYKQRRPRPILRSKSDISDRYRRPEPGSSSSPGASLTGSDEERLSRFFERLGLDDHQYREILHDPDPDEPVFFSDCSTVDSNRPHDYTVQGPPQKQTVQRNVEPPSIVERNARIIKWLCNCKKVQLLLHQP